MISATRYHMRAEVNRQTRRRSEIAKLQTGISAGANPDRVRRSGRGGAGRDHPPKAAGQATYPVNVAVAAMASAVDAAIE